MLPSPHHHPHHQGGPCPVLVLTQALAFLLGQPWCRATWNSPSVYLLHIQPACQPKLPGALFTQKIPLCKSMLIKPGEVPVLPNSLKQSLRVKQHEEAEGYVLNNRTKWNSRTNLLKQTSNLLDKEFKEMVIKMLTKLRRMEEHSEAFNKEVENIRKNQS